MRPRAVNDGSIWIGLPVLNMFRNIDGFILYWQAFSGTFSPFVAAEQCHEASSVFNLKAVSKQVAQMPANYQHKFCTEHLSTIVMALWSNCVAAKKGVGISLVDAGFYGDSEKGDTV